MNKQAKSLKLHQLKGTSEFSLKGFVCKILDNDGVTVLREWHEPFSQKLAIQECRRWLNETYGEKNENTTGLGSTLAASGAGDIKAVEGSID